jgi:O-antigen/teichoic acid export membrane protein
VTVSARHAAVHAAPTRPWVSVRRSAGARILVLPVSAILGVVSTRLIVAHFGTATYNQYLLLIGIGSLIPFADLGMAAAVMNAISGADDPAHDLRVRRVLTTAVRVLVCSAGVILLITAGITVAGWWPRLIGDGLLPHGGPAAALCAAMIGISMPAGLGQRIWTGLGRNHVAIVLFGLQTPVVLVCLVAIVSLHAGGGSYLPVIPYIVTLALAVGSTYWAGNQIGPAFWGALRDAPRVRSVRGGKVFDTAWPMLIQLIALPIAMQTDRLILSHVSDLKNLAEYNLASQLYLPVYYVLSAAGVSLWPIFARARAGVSRSGVAPLRMSLAFGGAAAGICALVSLLSPCLTQAASGGRIKVGVALMLSFSILMVFQATKYPLGMYMTDARGLRYQAVMIVLVLLPINLGLSWYLAIRIGAAGPVIGSAVGVFLSQVAANWVYVRRELRAVPPSQPDDARRTA